MNDKVILSIIILHYKSEQFLLSLLKSLLIFSPKSIKLRAKIAKAEVIVVDNASPVPIRQRIGKFFWRNGARRRRRGKLSWLQINGHGVAVKYLQSLSNRGFAAGNNLGLKLAEGRYILFLNPDTIVPAKTLLESLEYLKKHSKVGAVSPRLELADGTLDEACHRGFPTPWRSLCHFSGLEKIFPRWRLFSGYHLGWRLSKHWPHPVEAVSGAFLMVKREAGESIGWWDEDYFFYGEDIEFCFRLWKKGWQIYYLPNIKMRHYRGVSSGIKKHSLGMSKADLKTRLQAAKSSVEAMRIFYRKHYLCKYPWPVNKLVYFALWILEKRRLARVRRFYK